MTDADALKLELIQEIIDQIKTYQIPDSALIHDYGYPKWAVEKANELTKQK